MEKVAARRERDGELQFADRGIGNAYPFQPLLFASGRATFPVLFLFSRPRVLRPFFQPQPLLPKPRPPEQPPSSALAFHASRSSRRLALIFRVYIFPASSQLIYDANLAPATFPPIHGIKKRSARLDSTGRARETRDENSRVDSRDVSCILSTWIDIFIIDPRISALFRCLIDADSSVIGILKLSNWLPCEVRFEDPDMIQRGVGTRHVRTRRRITRN